MIGLLNLWLKKFYWSIDFNEDYKNPKIPECIQHLWTKNNIIKQKFSLSVHWLFQSRLFAHSTTPALMWCLVFLC